MNSVVGSSFNHEEQLRNAISSPRAVSSLQRQIKGLSKGLRIVADGCDRLLPPLRQHLRQFIDLAAIELDEALKALASCLPDPSVENVSPNNPLDRTEPAPLLNLEAIQRIAQDFRESQNNNRHTATPTVLGHPEALTNLVDHLELTAQTNDIPEANDLATILAKLKANQLADLDSPSDFTTPIASDNLRQELLDFDACQYHESSDNGSPSCTEKFTAGFPLAQPELQGNGTASYNFFPAGAWQQLALQDSQSPTANCTGIQIQSSEGQICDLQLPDLTTSVSALSGGISQENLTELQSLKDELEQIVKECKQNQSRHGVDGSTSNPVTGSIVNQSSVLF